jgi:hypothetical protein
MQLSWSYKRNKVACANSFPYVMGGALALRYREPVAWNLATTPRPAFASSAAEMPACNWGLPRRSGSHLFGERPGRNSSRPWEWDVATRGKFPDCMP